MASGSFLILPLIVLLTHPLVDAVKAAFSRVFGREERDRRRERAAALLADQAVHLAILYGTVVALLHPPPTSFDNHVRFRMDRGPGARQRAGGDGICRRHRGGHHR